jgi:hypothetical protein
MGAKLRRSLLGQIATAGKGELFLSDYVAGVRQSISNEFA